MDGGQWIGVFAGHVWILSQTDDNILYKSFCMKHPGDNQLTTVAASNGCAYSNRKAVSESYVADCKNCVDHSRLLQDYFQLSVNLQEMYKDWGQRGHCMFLLYCVYLGHFANKWLLVEFYRYRNVKNINS